MGLKPEEAEGRDSSSCTKTSYTSTDLLILSSNRKIPFIRKEILEKRKIREQRKQELSNRKSLAAKERMRILTKLADGGKCEFFKSVVFNEMLFILHLSDCGTCVTTRIFFSLSLPSSISTVYSANLYFKKLRFKRR